MHSRSVAQLCLPPCTPPGSSVHGLIQARILKWADISSFRGSFPPRDQTLSPALTGRFITSNHLGHPGMWSQVGLRCITLNGASGGDRIPVELFQILKDDPVKVRPENMENSAVSIGLEKVSFHSNPKERQYQRMLKIPSNCTQLTR